MTQPDTRGGGGAPAPAGLKAGRYTDVCRGRPSGRPGSIVAALSALVLLSLPALMAQQPSGKPVFTKEQADAGRVVYKNSCASCHTADLGGSPEYPQLAGDDFMSAWNTRTVRELYEFIQATMPPEGPMLATEQSLGVVALILYENGAPAGTTALTATTDAPIGSVATGKRPGR